MDNNLVSVIMPAFNASKYIGEAIESIINQTYKSWELIIIDDESSDKTFEIAKHYESYKIHVESRKNEGQSAQLNYGISLAKGKYVAIAHADDVNHFERLAEQVKFLNENQHIGFCGTFANVVFKDTSAIRKNSTTPTDCYISLFYGNPIIHPTAMIRKAILEKLPYMYNSNYIAAEDYDLWVRLADFAQFANIDKVLIDYRIHETSNSSTRKLEERILEKQIRLNLVKQLLKTERRHVQIKAYYFFYNFNKLNVPTIWRILFLIRKAFNAKKNLDTTGLSTFLKERFIAVLKQKPYRLRLTHVPLSPLLFMAFTARDALRILKTLYFSKS